MPSEAYGAAEYRIDYRSEKGVCIGTHSAKRSIAACLSPYAPAREQQCVRVHGQKAGRQADESRDVLGRLRTTNVDVDLVAVTRLEAHEIEHLQRT